MMTMSLVGSPWASKISSTSCPCILYIAPYWTNPEMDTRETRRTRTWNADYRSRTCSGERANHPVIKFSPAPWTPPTQTNQLNTVSSPLESTNMDPVSNTNKDPTSLDSANQDECSLEQTEASFNTKYKIK